MIKRVLLGILVVVLVMGVMIGCERSIDNYSVATDTKIESTPDPTFASMPEPTPAPIKVPLPYFVEIDDDIYYGMSIGDVVDIMGKPDASLNKTGSVDIYEPIEYHGYTIDGYSVILKLEFYEYSGEYIKKAYGLEAVSFIFEKTTEDESLDTLNSLYPKLVEVYGNPSKFSSRLVLDKNDKYIEDGIEEAEWTDFSTYPFINYVSCGITTTNEKYENHNGIMLAYYTAYMKLCNPHSWADVAENENDTAYYASGDQGVTLANYNKIYRYMTLREVEYYLGHGEKDEYEKKIGGDTYTYYEWYGDSVGRIKIQFVNGKVSIITKTGN